MAAAFPEPLSATTTCGVCWRMRWRRAAKPVSGLKAATTAHTAPAWDGRELMRGPLVEAGPARRCRPSQDTPRPHRLVHDILPTCRQRSEEHTSELQSQLHLVC